MIGAYHQCVAETVGRFDGFVAKYMGDGVLVYFGYPQAHEDDAERAVRAGLDLIDAVGRLEVKSVTLQARVGIGTGLVVVGDLIGEGSAREQSVVGETPNFAARLQALARPGTLVIADSTRRQIGGLFEIEDLGLRALAGFAEPQRAWHIVGDSGVLSRFEALGSEATPLVGRDEELELLLRRWHHVTAGEGRVVLVSGEPGIGKSRLSAALSQRIQADPHVRLRYFCSMNIAVFMDEVMPINGPLMLVPRSHRQGVLAAGHDDETTSYPLWTLDKETVTRLVDEGGIVAPTGKPGSVLMFHGNLVHGSAPNITPYPRRIVYLTLCAVSNYIRKPTRPEWIAHRDFTPIEPVPDNALLQYARCAMSRAAAE